MDQQARDYLEKLTVTDVACPHPGDQRVRPSWRQAGHGAAAAAQYHAAVRHQARVLHHAARRAADPGPYPRRRRSRSAALQRIGEVVIDGLPPSRPAYQEVLVGCNSTGTASCGWPLRMSPPAWRRVPRSCTPDRQVSPGAIDAARRGRPQHGCPDSEPAMHSGPGGTRQTDWYALLGSRLMPRPSRSRPPSSGCRRQANALAVTGPERARAVARPESVRSSKTCSSGPQARQRYDYALNRRAAAAPADWPTIPGPSAPMPAVAAFPPSPAVAPPPPLAPPPLAPPPLAPPPLAPPPLGGPVRPAAVYRSGPQPPGLMSRISKFLQTGWTCVGCGYGALPTDKFCPKCGSRVEPGLEAGQQAGIGSYGLAQKGRPPACSNCGGTVAPRDAFCKRCGNSLAPSI